VRTSVGSWEEVDEKLEIEMPLRRGVDAVPGDERRPRKRTSKGREVGECALSTKPLSSLYLVIELTSTSSKRSTANNHIHDVVTVTFSLGLLRSMASPTSTNSLTVRQSLDWPLWSGHFPTSFAGRKGSSGLLAGCAEAGAVYVPRTKPPLAPTKRRA